MGQKKWKWRRNEMEDTLPFIIITDKMIIYILNMDRICVPSLTLAKQLVLNQTARPPLGAIRLYSAHTALNKSTTHDTHSAYLFSSLYIVPRFTYSIIIMSSLSRSSAASDHLPPLSSLPVGLYPVSAHSPSTDRLATIASSNSMNNLRAGAGPILMRQQSVLLSRAAGSPQIDPSSLPPDEQRVVNEYHARVSANPHVAIAVCAIQALTSVVRASSASTMMGLEKELQRAVHALKACNPASISLAAGCELFSRYVTRAALDIPRFDACVARVLERGEQFSLQSQNSRAAISELVDRFIADGKVLLIHGFSRVVHAVLRHAASRGKNFSCVVTEGRPNNDGYHACAELLSAGIPCKLILDSAVAWAMGTVDLVLIGAEGVAESGGVINKIGTFQMCLAAQAMRKPVYVAAESYKFARLFPLGQNDLPETREQQPPLKPAMPVGKAAAAAVAASPAANLAPPSLDGSNSNTAPGPTFPATSSVNGNVTGASVSGVSASTIQSSADLIFSPDSSSHWGDKLQILNPSCDYTPPEFLTLLFTDIGILTPSAVSDELIKLYY
jgi:translation initiation factor eIF-2B subunit alpha